MWLSILLVFLANDFEGWETFADVQFEIRYVEELGYDVEYPVFDMEIMKKAGDEMILSGYYLPIDLGSQRVILSKLPFASCFFCGGGGGQESVAEVVFAEEPRRFVPDEIIKVKGRLKLNQDDYDHMVFILEDAILIE